MWLVRDINTGRIWRNNEQKEAFNLDRNFDLWRNALAHVMLDDVRLWEDAHSKALKTGSIVKFQGSSRTEPYQPKQFLIVVKASACAKCKEHCAVIVQKADLVECRVALR